MYFYVVESESNSTNFDIQKAITCEEKVCLPPGRSPAVAEDGPLQRKQRGRIGRDQN